MVPTIDQQISAVVRSLRETIIPAIDPGNKLAAMQVELCVTVLRTIAGHYDQAFHLALTELGLYSRFLDEVAQGDCTAIEPELRARLSNGSAKKWATLCVPERREIDAITLELREVADALVKSTSIQDSVGTRRSVMGAVGRLSRAEVELRRSWMAGMGVEGANASVPTIDSLIAAKIAPI